MGFLILLQAAELIAAMEKASAPLRELTVQERGRLWVEGFGEVASVEWRTGWVRGGASRLEVGAAMDPTFVHPLVPLLEASLLLVETPEHLAGRLWAANLPPIAKGYVLPVLAFRADRRGDPLALPAEFPLRFLCDRLLLRATLEPAAWIPAGKLDHTVSLKELLGAGTLLARLPLGDLTRRFKVDPATRRLTAIELEIPLTAEGAILQIVHRAEAWRDVEGVAMPSRTTVTVRWGRDEEWNRVLQLTSEMESVEPRVGGESLTRGVDGAPAALGALLEKPADPYARAWARIKEEVVAAILEERLPKAMAPDLRRDVEEAVRAEPANPFYAAAYLELFAKGRDAELLRKMPAEIPEVALLLGGDLEKALAVETFPFLRRKLMAARGGAFEGSFEERRWMADAAVRAMKRPTSEGFEELLAAHRARAPADPILHYLAAVAAARAGEPEPFIKAVARMAESPEAARAAADLIRPHFAEDARMSLADLGGALRPVAERLVAADPGDPFGHFLLAESQESAEAAAPHLDRALELLESGGPRAWTPDRVRILAKAATPPEGDEMTDRMRRAARLYLSCAESAWELIPDEMQYDSNPAGVVAAGLVKAGELEEALEVIGHPGFLPGLDYSYGVWEAVQESGSAQALVEAARERLADGTFGRTGCVALAQGIQWFVGLESEEMGPFLREATKAHPGEPMLWFFRGQMGGEESMDAYRKALALWEAHPAGAGRLADYHINNTRWVLARSLRGSDPAEARRLMKGIDFGSSNGGYFAREAVKMLIEEGAASEAVEMLRPHEEKPQLLLDLAIALEADGKLLEAWKYFARAAEAEMKPGKQHLYNHHQQGGRGPTPARRLRDDFTRRVDRASLMETFFAQSFDPVGEAEQGRIRGLVERLRSEDLAVREAAQRELKAMGRKIAPVLRGSLADRDPEVAVRVRSLIDDWMFE